MDSHLLDLTAAQSGLVTTAQAHAAGLDRWGLRRLVRARALLSVTRGVYAVWTTSEGQLSVEARHLRLGRAMALLYPDCRLAGHTALVAMDLPVWGADLKKAHLERPVGREVLTQDAVIRPVFGPSAATTAESVTAESGSERVTGESPTVEGGRPTQDKGRQVSRLTTVMDVERPPTVSPAVALIQHSLQNGAAAGVVAADAALHTGLLDIEELEFLVAFVRGWPRSSRARTVLAHADGTSESVGESRLRFGLAMVGIELIPQVRITNEHGAIVARVDFTVAGTNVVVEFDGLVKYREGGPQALVAEKRREDELRRLGYVVVRVIWSELDRPGLIAARIRAAASPGKVVLHPRTDVG
jgi:very-short-patch-repair endonuclease